jgi:hypothetical protein
MSSTKMCKHITIDNDSLVGRKQGNYRFERRIGRGGLSTVYLVRRRPLWSGPFWLIFLIIFLPAFLCFSAIAITLLNRSTAPPSSPPTIQSPVPTPTATPTPTQQAQKVVQQYYDDWNQRNYHAAYNLLGADYQRANSYDSLASSYENTESSEITIDSVTPLSNGTFRIIVTDHAAEKDASGGTVKRVYRVTYTVGQENGTWKILNVTVQVIG